MLWRSTRLFILFLHWSKTPFQCFLHKPFHLDSMETMLSSGFLWPRRHGWWPSSINKHHTKFWATGGRPRRGGPSWACHAAWEHEQESPTFFSFSEVGLRMVSSGRLGLGLGDSQELKKDWMKGSRCCPFWKRGAHLLETFRTHFTVAKRPHAQIHAVHYSPPLSACWEPT